jgi:hypothetical protein
MNDYQQEIKAILALLDELEYAKEPKKWNQIITEIITKISEHQSILSMDNVADISYDYVEKINYAKQELEIAKRTPQNSKLHLDIAKESLIHAKDINWQMQED